MVDILYPLRFCPIFQYRIWGGDKIKNILCKKVTQEYIGESWEISSIPGYLSIVSNGVLAGKSIKDLVEIYKDKLLGKKNYKKFGIYFPLLIKFIDAKKSLSIQVHPNDNLAKKRHNSFGKSEMWYIMQTEEKSEVIIGFNKSISRNQYFKLNKTNKIEKYLNKISVKKGEIYYLPSGRIHAIGSGILIAEIQQSSNITYRIYDYNRLDKNGYKRKLNTIFAYEAIDFSLYKTYKTYYKTIKNKFSKILNTSFFNVNILSIFGKIQKNYLYQDSFTILILIEGIITIKTFSNNERLKIGDVLLLPACTKETEFESIFGGKLLEITIQE